MANKHTTLTSLFDDIANAIRTVTPVTAQIVADAFPAYIRMADYTGTIPADPTNLNACSWDFIRWASDEGLADLIWSVGDRKSVSVGEWGSQYSGQEIDAGTYSCYIIGFNHNSSVEGNNRIHFEFGFTAVSGGTHIAFTSQVYTQYWTTDTTTTYFQRMNPTNTNIGGWEDCTMRTGTLNGTTRSFNLAVPTDLRNVVKTVIKYTDNVGGGHGNVQANVTATTDRFFLLNVKELRGSGSANTYESNKTEQYQYYKNGNQQIRYRSNDTSTLCIVGLRSPSATDSTQFMGLNTSGSGVYLSAKTSYGYSPAFCV